MKTLRVINGILLAFIALNAFGGGYYALAGAENVPLQWLEGSPFRSYLIPGLFLFIVIGGICTGAAIAAFANSKYANALAFISGGLLLAWISIQVLIIGYVSWMQPAIFISSLLIISLAWLIRKQQT